jgi:hypothetical protein
MPSINTLKMSVGEQTGLGDLITTNGGRLLDKVLSGVVATTCASQDIRVRQMSSAADYAELKAARLRMYTERAGYFDKLIAVDGSDRHDTRSYHFAAFHAGRIIGAIRLTPYPFEVCSYIDSARLKVFLGRKHETRTLEFSRLVVERRAPVKGVSRALIIYAGLLTSILTEYDKYVAVARRRVKQKSFKFNLVPTTLPFFIEERGTHEYELISGSFVSDFYDIMSDHAATFKEIFFAESAGTRESY